MVGTRGIASMDAVSYVLSDGRCASTLLDDHAQANPSPRRFPQGSRPRMSNAATSTPKFSDVQYRVVGPLGTGAGSTILQIADRSRGGKKIRAQGGQAARLPTTTSTSPRPRSEFEAAQKLNHPAIARIYDSRVKRNRSYSRW